jgi:O-acetyl-ADP-ribose deacetylase (regulator of RNase III)
VIHTVGPVYDYADVDRCRDELQDAYINSMIEADKLGCKSVAFPAISCGVYGYPYTEAASIAISAVMDYPADNIEDVHFIMFDPDTLAAFLIIAQAIGKYHPGYSCEVTSVTIT